MNRIQRLETRLLDQLQKLFEADLIDRDDFNQAMAEMQRRLTDYDDDDQDHWQRLGDVVGTVLEKAERAFQQNHKPEDGQ